MQDFVELYTFSNVGVMAKFSLLQQLWKAIAPAHINVNTTKA